MASRTWVLFRFHPLLLLLLLLDVLPVLGGGSGFRVFDRRVLGNCGS